MKFLIAVMAVAMAHQSFQGSSHFAPHVEEVEWQNKDDPNGQKFRTDHTRGRWAGDTTGNDLRGAEQDDNYLNKDDDRRVYAPAYDDHVSYSHHPVAHQYSDEHYHDDEGQSTRVIHGQDTSQHVNRRTKKKVFDTIKEPKHHFAVQSIDVPFPFHHHYYNHTKVHYHDGYDLYDDDVGDSEKYYHVNPDTHTNVDGWFADDHYRISNEAFTDDGATADDGFLSRSSGDGNFRRSDNDGASARQFHGGETHGDYTQQYPYGQAGRTGGLAEGSYGDHGAYNRFKADDAATGQVYPNANYRAELPVGDASDDSVANRPEADRYRWFATDRLAEWRMRSPNWAPGQGQIRWSNTGTGTRTMSKGAPRRANRRGKSAKDWDWVPFSANSFANAPLITNKDGSAADGSEYGGFFQGGKWSPTTANAAMWSSDKPLTNAGTIGALGARTYSRGYYGQNKRDSDISGAQANAAGGGQGDNTLTTKDVDNFRRGRGTPGFKGKVFTGGNARAYQGIQAQVGMDGKSLPFKTFGQKLGTEGTYVGGLLSNYKYNWDNAELSSYPRGIRENTTGQDEDGQDDDYQQDNVEDNRNDNDGAEYNGPAGGNNGSTTGLGGWTGSWNVQALAQSIADSIMGQFREYGSGMFPSGSESPGDRR